MTAKRKHVATGQKRGGAAPRNDEGYTPRQKLDAIKAQSAYIDLQVKRGQMVLKSEVDARDAADNEVLLSKLKELSVNLPAKLSGRVFSSHEAKRIIDAAISEMVNDLRKGGDLSGG